MKKLIILLSLFLVISLQAQTQTSIDGPIDEDLDVNQIAYVDDSEVSPGPDNIDSFDQIASDDVAALSAKIVISDDLKRNIFELMTEKHDELHIADLTVEEKNAISLKYKEIVLAILDEAQKSIVVPDTQLMYRMSH